MEHPGRQTAGAHPGRHRAPPAVCLGLLLLASGCATGGVDWVREPVPGFVHGELGYRIARPEVPGDRWRRVKVDGADLAFRSQDGPSMSLLSDCKRVVARPPILARQLVIGLGARELTQASPLAHRGMPGWTQTFVLREPDGDLTVKTVTVSNERCTFDWVLVAGPDFGALEPVFDTWWESFDVDPDSGAEEERE